MAFTHCDEVFLWEVECLLVSFEHAIDLVLHLISFQFKLWLFTILLDDVVEVLMGHLDQESKEAIKVKLGPAIWRFQSALLHVNVDLLSKLPDVFPQNFKWTVVVHA